jgi:preprotein translocase subunit SecY
MIKIKDLRKKITLTLLMLLIYKIGTYISVPGINRDVLKTMVEGTQTGVLSVANLISGGALAQFSIFAVGIMPYITASILIQLLSMDVVPKLTEWTKQGEMGSRKTKNLTRYVAVVVAIIQSYGMSFGFSKAYPGLVENNTIGGFLMVALFLTLGTVLLIILGEIIEKKGLGSGISVIIFGGIIMSVPSAVSMYYTMELQGAGDQLFIAIAKAVIVVMLLLALLVTVVYVHKAERRIPIQHSVQTGNVGNLKGRDSSQTNFLPIKLNTAGVFPVIFAVALVMTPTTIAQFFPTKDWSAWILNYLSMQSVTGMILYAVFIILFSYFYAFIQTNPEKLADELKKSGSFVPGIRPGKSTEEYITKILKRLTFVGSLFLTTIALIPMILANFMGLPAQIQIGGVSLIIVVSVGLDVMSKVQTQLTQRNYKGFLK